MLVLLYNLQEIRLYMMTSMHYNLNGYNQLYLILLYMIYLHNQNHSNNINQQMILYNYLNDNTMNTNIILIYNLYVLHYYQHDMMTSNYYNQLLYMYIQSLNYMLFIHNKVQQVLYSMYINYHYYLLYIINMLNLNNYYILLYNLLYLFYVLLYMMINKMNILNLYQIHLYLVHMNIIDYNNNYITMNIFNYYLLINMI